MTLFTSGSDALDDTGNASGGPSAGDVAAVIAGLPSIGVACEALRGAGWRSTIAGNRITVNDRVFARFIDGGVGGGVGDATGGAAGDCARWLVYGIGKGDRPAVSIVDADVIR